MPEDRRLRAFVSVAAGVLTAVAVLLPPAIYFLVSYEYAEGLVEAEAEINARLVNRVVAANPELWRYEQLRLGEYLGRRPRDGRAEHRRVLDVQGDAVAESLDPLPWPHVTRSVPLLDAGMRVGRLEISQSIRPLVMRSGGLALVLLVVGVVSFRAVRTVPLRAIRRSQEAVRRERDTAQRYLDVAGVAFVTTGEGGQVTLVNRKGRELLGRPEAEIVGRDWISTFVDPVDRARVAAETASATRPDAVVPLEYAVLRPSGERRVVAWYLTPLVDGERRAGLLASGVDVTAQRKLEEQLRNAQKLEAIGRLAGGVAHDFNNLLSVVKGYAVLLRRRIADEAPHRRYVDEILASTERAASLTTSLLAFGRRQTLQSRPMDLVDFVRGFERSLRGLVDDGIELRTELPSEPLLLNADRLQIERVLMNLVTNAQDAMPDGGRIVVSASRATLDAAEAAAAGLDAPGPYARLAVADTGTGIAPEAQGRLFEPFFTTKAFGKGSGLGLSIAYAIAKQHGGVIQVASEPGKGSTFTLFLPLLGSAPLAPRPAEDEAAPPGGTETLLVADDDDAVREMLRQVLEGAGYGVVEAVDGNDAVRRFEEHRNRIRLAILDVAMPHEDGRNALARIRHLDPSIRAFFLSGHVDLPTSPHPIDLGDDLLLRKPADPLELLRTVRRMLDA